MKFALGRKLEMTQMFDSEGIVHPVTIISLEDKKITQIKSKEKDGYCAVQVGYGSKKKIIKGKKEKTFGGKKEFKMEDASSFNVGDDLSNDLVIGDMVKISASSKGKGFAGVVKRHGFGGGPRTHGQKHNERTSGSIGAGLRCRVPKGMKMAGRMGNDKITIKGIKVVDIDKEKKIVFLHGSIPGRRGSLIEIETI